MKRAKEERRTGKIPMKDKKGDNLNRVDSVQENPETRVGNGRRSDAGDLNETNSASCYLPNIPHRLHTAITLLTMTMNSNKFYSFMVLQWVIFFRYLKFILIEASNV